MRGVLRIRLLAENQVLTDVFDSIKDIFSLFLMIVF